MIAISSLYDCIVKDLFLLSLKKRHALFKALPKFNEKKNTPGNYFFAEMANGYDGNMSPRTPSQMLSC